MIKDILFLKCGFVNTIVNHFWLVFIKVYSGVRIINLLHCFDPFCVVHFLSTLTFLQPK